MHEPQNVYLKHDHKWKIEKFALSKLKDIHKKTKNKTHVVQFIMSRLMGSLKFFLVIGLTILFSDLLDYIVSNTV